MGAPACGQERRGGRGDDGTEGSWETHAGERRKHRLCGTVWKEAHGWIGMDGEAAQMSISRYLRNYGWEVAQTGMTSADGMGWGLGDNKTA